MAKKYRHTRRKLESKFVFRRAMLVIIALVIVGTGSWAVYGRVSGPKTDGGQGDSDPPAPRSSQASQAEPSQPSEESPPSSDKQEGGADASDLNAGGEELETDEVAQAVNSARLDDWQLILVNQDNYLPDSFDVNLVEVVDGYRVDERIYDPLVRMFANAQEAGVSLIICSAYRDVDRQTVNFNNKVTELMNQGIAKEEATRLTATVIAVPGSSEHHTGLAVDIVTASYQNLDEGFEGTAAFEWLNTHAAEYGFVLRFPKDKQDITGIIYEPWHYRYVGTEHAAIMNQYGLCLEEYVALLQQQAGLNAQPVNK